MEDADVLEVVRSWCPYCHSWFGLHGPNGWFNHVLVGHPGTREAKGVQEMIERRLTAMRQAEERYRARARGITRRHIEAAPADVWGKYPPARPARVEGA